MRHQPAQTPAGLGHRYDKLAVRYLATAHIAAIDKWL
jgi:hypothetical protein